MSAQTLVFVAGQGGSEHSGNVVLLYLCAVGQCIVIAPVVVFPVVEVSVLLVGLVAFVAPISFRVVERCASLRALAVRTGNPEFQFRRNLPGEVGIQVQLAVQIPAVLVLHGLYRIVAVVRRAVDCRVERLVQYVFVQFVCKRTVSQN